MENKDDLLKKINSNDPESVAEALNDIKENGDETMIPLLLDLLEETQDSRVISGIANLLSDIRENSFRTILVSRIRQTQNAQLKSVLLRIAWESSLDYSSDLDLFTDILLHDDFVAAFEASTLIENLVHNLTSEQQEQLRALFEDGIPEDKKFLIENIVEEMEMLES